MYTFHGLTSGHPRKDMKRVFFQVVVNRHLSLRSTDMSTSTYKTLLGMFKLYKRPCGNSSILLANVCCVYISHHSLLHNAVSNAICSFQSDIRELGLPKLFRSGIDYLHCGTQENIFSLYLLRLYILQYTRVCRLQ